MIYKITQKTKKSQSPGTENLKCLGIQNEAKEKKTVNEKTDKLNKPQEVLKGSNNCIWKTRFFEKRGSSNLSGDKT